MTDERGDKTQHDVTRWVGAFIACMEQQGIPLELPAGTSLQDKLDRVRAACLAEIRQRRTLAETDKALRAHEALLHTFITHVPAAVAMFDREMRYIAVSRRWLTDYHLGERNIIGLSHYEVFPEIGERWKAIHRHTLTGVTMRCEEDPFPRADGTLDWVRWEIVPWYQPDGSVGGITIFTEVITERKRAAEERERLLAEVEQRAAELDATFNAIGDGIAITDVDGCVQRLNAAGEALLGVNLAALRTGYAERIRLLEITHPDGTPFRAEEAATARALRGESFHGLIQVLHRPDRTRWLSLGAGPIRTPDGLLLGAVVTFTDITALHELQERERRYLYTVAHDLRAPATIIDGHVRLLLEALQAQQLAGTFRTQIEAVQRALQRMHRMIDHLTTMVTLEEAPITPAPGTLALAEYVAALFQQHAAVLETSRLRVEIPPDLPPVCADPAYLERILLNLLLNAQKYSPPDTPILLSARRTDGMVELAVRDHGAGISPVDLPHIFERFYRAPHGRKAEGLGLGLYLTHQLVEAQGGTIRAESTLGQGSTFFVTLPRA